MARPSSAADRGDFAVSVITCTRRAECMHRLLRNYVRQHYRQKELIVILNNDRLNPEAYRQAALAYGDIRIYRLPGRMTLGACLNHGVKRARYPLIAKFDDDDYYAADYLTNSVRCMRRTRADIVGKRAHFMRLGGTRQLLLRYPAAANRYVPLVQGATLLIRRRVFRKVAFPNRTRGECVKLCADSRARGFRIYAGDPFNFLAIRKRNSANHTWIVSDRRLLTRNVKHIEAKRIRDYIMRP